MADQPVGGPARTAPAKLSSQDLFHYRLGSVPVSSEIALPGLPAASPPGHDGITVRRSSTPAREEDWRLVADEPKPEANARLRTWSSRGSPRDLYRLRFEYRHHFADFVITVDGSEVEFSSGGGLTEQHLATLLQGPVLGRALRLNGYACLHAAVLFHDGKAVALMGSSGAGKSSLASGLVQAGCTLVADDLAAFSVDGDHVLVSPGRQQLRLWQDAALRWRGRSISVTRHLPGIEEMKKMVLDLGGEAISHPVRLHSVYQLRPRDSLSRAPRVDDLSPPGQLAALLSNVYGSLEPPREGRRAEVARLADTAARIHVRALTLPDSLDLLDEAAEPLMGRLFQ